MQSNDNPQATARYLTRAAAAQYVRATYGFPCSRQWLAKLAVVGGGPVYRKAGRTPLYAPSDLDGGRRPGSARPSARRRRRSMLACRRGVTCPRASTSARVKSNRTYRVDEAAAVTGTHRNTVRNWIKAGLTVIAGRRPLILGGDIIAFHRARRVAARTPSPRGTIYRLPCRKPQRPDGNMADFVIDDAGVGKLQGLCPACGRVMSRIVNPSRLEQVADDLEVQHMRRKPTL